MICPNCNSNIMDGSSFCVKCGANLMNGSPNNIGIQPMPNQMQQNNMQMAQPMPNQMPQNNMQMAQPMPNQMPQNNMQMAQPMPNQMPQNNMQMAQPMPNQMSINPNYVQNPTSNMAAGSVAPQGGFNLIMTMLTFPLKPFSKFKENEEKLKEPKNSLLIGGIVAVLMMLISIIKNIIAIGFFQEYNVEKAKYVTSFDFERLKNIKWISVIFKDLLWYAILVFGIAAIYYMACLIIKKDVKFTKLLSSSALSFIPYVALSMIASSIAIKIWIPLSVIISLAGIIYSITIFFNLINNDIEFDKKDQKIYFHASCILITIIVLSLLYSAIILGDVSKIIDIFDI